MFKINRETASHKLYKIITTCLLIDFTWLFFRANNINQAIEMIKSIFSKYNPWILFDGSLYKLGLDSKDFTIMVIAILILICADFIKWKGYIIREWVNKQGIWFRWGFYIISIMAILIFGIWGPEYNENGFIYFQF